MTSLPVQLRSLAAVVSAAVAIAVIAVAAFAGRPPIASGSPAPSRFAAPGDSRQTPRQSVEPASSAKPSPQSTSSPIAAPPVDQPSRPNIVVIYLDDVDPHDGRLWNDPARTPNLHEHFVAHGLTFDRAIVETPLCCPARVQMLTGLHSHNSGVTRNLGPTFDPSMHVGKQLRDAGYASMWIGKYLNNNDKLTPAQWLAHQAGWTVLDAIYGTNGEFDSFTLKTKEGRVAYPTTPSTQMVADRAVMRFRETPADQPIFAVLSIYDLHLPNLPQPQFLDDPRCADIPAWSTPAYNEDVSDKPPGVQGLPPHAYSQGWPMVTYCEEMLGVDAAVGQVLAELEVEGRLENTVLVFTADNGVAWGAHRLGQRKQWPYTTPVPLILRWPAGHWGDAPTVNSELVTNIDLAPTFCELGGCTLGPYSHGKPAADGLSLVPLTNGRVGSLGRDALLEESYGPQGNSWAGLRTTSVFDPSLRWHYVEYGNGFRELYELSADPWELENLVDRPELGDLVSQLHGRLAELRSEGIADGTGFIRIVENNNADPAADYLFSGELGNFTLDDDADRANPSAVSFTKLDSGVYSFRRTHASDSALQRVDCTGGVSQVDLATETLTVFLRPKDTVVCTFVDVPGRPVASPPPA